MKFNIDIISSSSLDDMEGAICKLDLKGSLDSNNIYKFNFILNSLIDGGINKIILDISGLQYLDSTAIGAIIFIIKKLRGKKGETIFTRYNTQILNIVKPIKLEKFIKFFATNEEGIRHLNSI